MDLSGDRNITQGDWDSEGNTTTEDSDLDAQDTGATPSFEYSATLIACHHLDTERYCS